MTETDEQLLSIGDAAIIAGVTVQSLRRWADAGEVPSVVTPGGHRRFRRSDVIGLLKAPDAATEKDTPA